MARDHLDPDLQTTIDSGHIRQHSCVDITLSDGTPLHFATSEEMVGAVSYLAQLDPPSPLRMGLSNESDSTEFKVQNVDMAMGQALTGVARRFDGAEAMLGTVFVNDATEEKWYDPRIPGELVQGDVIREHVAFKFVDWVSARVIAGRAVAEEFPWRDPVAENPGAVPPGTIPTVDPDLVTPPGRGPGGGGRYPSPVPMEIL